MINQFQLSKIMLRFLIIGFSCILLQSCTETYRDYGKVSPYKSSSNSTTFLFKIEGGFVAKGSKAKKDEIHTLMNKAQVQLLKEILIDKNLCLDRYNYPKFKITSKQERIYDVTFANLIEQNYNTRPVAPLTYFGQCA